jgi:acetyl esterase/lipase
VPIPPDPAVRRVADLLLRSREGLLAARVYWPATALQTPLLLVLFDAGRPVSERFCRKVCARTNMVVVVISLPSLGAVAAAMMVLEWAADHAAELDADPARLVVAGLGRGDEIAAAAARRAHVRGWPPVARLTVDELVAGW